MCAGSVRDILSPSVSESHQNEHMLSVLFTAGLLRPLVKFYGPFNTE